VSNRKHVDVVLIGGGIMSATLGTLLRQVQPDWSIQIFERLGRVAEESSNPWNNAGTGHAALCELNYMPEATDGSLTPNKAIEINEQFQISRQWWSTLVAQGILDAPETFINSTPHMTFVHGENNVDYLRRRYEILKDEPLFAGIEYTEDPAVIAEWAPLLIQHRKKGEAIAATRVIAGTDVDYGAVTRQLFNSLINSGAELELNHGVTKLKRLADGTWDVYVKNLVGYGTLVVNAKFVFVGAGGGALKLLQSARIPEIRGFGGFPISGEFMRCDNPEVVEQHRAKVYGKAAVGAPPMSVPHFDARIVDGETSLLFGPYAGFSPKFLKKGSWFDLPSSIRWHNIGPMLGVARHNLDLMKYLIGEVLAGRSKKMAALREFMPTAKDEDWYLITAGQRVQVMKKDAKKGGVLQFGTEVIVGADGTIAGLLGASPGASIAVHVMLDLLERCFPTEYPTWRKTFEQSIPNLGEHLNAAPKKAKATLSSTAKVLQLEN
jgi:malate dehydrogenase (quinone)